MIITAYCTLIQHDKFGECAVADRDIAAGTVVIEEVPKFVIDYTAEPALHESSAISAYKRKRAYMTLSRAAKESLAFAQNLDLTKELCRTFFIPDINSAMVKSSTAYRAAVRGVDELDRRREYFPEIHALDRDTLISHSLLVSANAHAFEDDSVACLALGCKVTHTCFNPNVAVSIRSTMTQDEQEADQVTVKHIAIKDIAKGELLYGTYAQLTNMTAAERRKYLRHHKMFLCRCNYCAAKDRTRGLKCLACVDTEEAAEVVAPISTMYSTNSNDKTASWVCQNCKTSKPSDEVLGPSSAAPEILESRLRKGISSLDSEQESAPARFASAQKIHQECLATFSWRHCLTAAASISVLSTARQAIDSFHAPSADVIDQALSFFEQIPPLLETWYAHLGVAAADEMCDLYLQISEQLMTLSALQHDTIPRAMDIVQSLLLRVRPSIEERRHWPIAHVLQEYYDEQLVTLNDLVNGTQEQDSLDQVAEVVHEEESKDITT